MFASGFRFFTVPNYSAYRYRLPDAATRRGGRSWDPRPRPRLPRHGHDPRAPVPHTVNEE